MSIFAQDVVTIAVTLLVNVSDGAVAQDVVNAQMGDSQVIVAEAPTVADATTIQMGDFEVVVNEQPTVADVVVDITASAVAGDEDVDVAELPSVADVPNISVEDHEININDPPVASDIVEALVVSFADVNEQPAVSDSPTVEVGDLEVDVSEVPTVSDVALSTMGDEEVDVSEQPSVVDDATVQEQAAGDENVSVNEQPTASDVVTAEVGDLEVYVTEEPSVVDDPNIEPSVLGAEDVNVNEQPSVADSPTVEVSDLEINVSETPSVADAIEANVPASFVEVNVNEQPTVADAVIDSVGFHYTQPYKLFINTGSIVSGDVQDVYEDDGTDLTLAETTGTPGFDYEFHFQNVPDVPLSLVVNGYYDGSSGHNIDLKQWNFTLAQWDTVQAAAFGDEVSPQDYLFTLLTPNSDYIQNGEVRLQVVHTSAGNITHELILDAFLLSGTPLVDVNEKPVVHDYVTVWIEGSGPGVPTILSVDSIASDALRIRYTAVGGADYYNLYRSTDGVNFNFVVSTEDALVPTGTTMLDLGPLSPLTTYWYKVSAVNASGEGPLSTAMSGITLDRDLEQVVIADAIELFFDANQYPKNIASIFSIWTEGDVAIGGNVSLSGILGMGGTLFMGNNPVNWGGSVEGAWRIQPGTYPDPNLYVQRYEGGAWVTKHTFTP